MIIDKLKNFEHYCFGPAWKLAFEFLSSLTPDAEEKRYNIQGDDIFAIVMSYKTREPESAILESHRNYVDIQTVLVGGEGFECSFIDELIVDKPYNESIDAEFYKRIYPANTRVNVFPGTFIMLHPHDAHMPALMIYDKAELVKKVVIKIKVELLSATSNMQENI
jgi:YhcH/YjgK/YiaL family protein